MTITTKTFNASLASTIKSAKTMRTNAQLLIDFGFIQYKDTGDSGYLSRIVAACIGVKSLNTAKMIGYIESIANVKHAKSKDGSHVFKKTPKEEPTINDYCENWYEFETAETVQGDFDVAAKIAAIVKGASKASEAGRTVKVEGNAEAIAELQAMIKTLQG